MYTEEEHDLDFYEDANGDRATNDDGASTSSANHTEYGEGSNVRYPDRDLQRSSLDDDTPAVRK